MNDHCCKSKYFFENNRWCWRQFFSTNICLQAVRLTDAILYMALIFGQSQLEFLPNWVCPISK